MRPPCVSPRITFEGIYRSVSNAEMRLAHLRPPSPSFRSYGIPCHGINPFGGALSYYNIHADINKANNNRMRQYFLIILS